MIGQRLRISSLICAKIAGRERRRCRRRSARGCARRWRRRRRRASPPRRSRRACTEMSGHCLRFASTPVSAQVMTQRSGSRSLRSWHGPRRCLRRITKLDVDVFDDGSATRCGELRAGSASRSRISLGDEARRARCGRSPSARPGSRARACAPLSVRRMWTTRRSSVDRARDDEPLALHAIDDPGDRAVLRADPLRELGEREVADVFEQLDDGELRAR